MSQKSSGLKAPSKIGRPSALPKSGLPGSKAQNALEKSARAAGMTSHNAEKYANKAIHKLPGPESSVSPSPPPDDFRIGERVWVSGTKPGIIAFIGETQFAPGEWAGVVLDEAIGKNDGSVAGMRYFQCEAKRGVFSRVTKLSKTPDVGAMKAPTSGGSHSNTSVLDSSVFGGAPPSTPLAASTPAKVTAPSHTDGSSGEHHPTTTQQQQHIHHPKMGSMAKPTSGLAKPGNVHGSQTNLARGSLGTGGSQVNLAAAADSKQHNLRVGDRVLVSGSKAGTLRYVGPTDFAPGEWAGVELDDSQGKNDGAVAGKRYFDCRPQCGIFAKVSKVTKVGGLSVANLSSLQTPRRTSTGGGARYGGGLSSLTRDRSGSQDSISSIGSSVSTSSRSRVRLGVTSLNDNKKTAKTSTTSRPKPPSLGLATANTALQKALKEKEEHIDQLLQERDIERSELARASAKCDHAETELAALRTEHERMLQEQEDGTSQLQARVQKLEVERKDLTLRLEEEKRKVEDLQFSVEEATINIDEKELLSEESIGAVERAHDLEKQLNSEKERNRLLDEKLDNLKAQYTEYKAKAKDAEDTSVAYLDQIEELTHKLTMSETKIKGFEEDKLNRGQQSSEYIEELNQKNQHITRLERQVTEKERALSDFKVRLGELDEEVVDKVDKTQKLQDTIDELMQKLALSDTQSSNLNGELQKVKSHIADLQRQLELSEDKSQQLENEKQQLEGQLQDTLKLSGEGSEHLHLMNEQLLDKDRKQQELKAALSDSTREVGKLRRELEAQRNQTERETETLLSKHAEDLRGAGRQLEEKEAEITKLQSKLEKVKEQQKEERDALSSKTEGDIGELQRSVERKEEQLSGVRRELEDVRGRAGEIQEDRDRLKFEKEKLAKQLKSLEEEHQSVSTELGQVKSEKGALEEKHQSVFTELGQVKSERGSLAEKHQSVCKELGQVRSEKGSLEEKYQSVSTELDQVKSERGALEEKHQSVCTELGQVKSEKGTLEVEKTELLTQHDKLQERLAVLETEKQRFGGQTDTIMKEKESLQQSRQDLEDQLSRIRQENSSVSSVHDNLTQKITALEKQITEVTSERDQFKTEVDRSKEELSKGADHLNSLQQEVSKQQTDFTDLSRRVLVVETERDALKLQVKTLKAKEEERGKTETQQEEIKKQMEELRVSSSQMREEFDTEKQSLQTSLVAAKLQVEQTGQEMDQLKTQLAHLQGENLTMNTFKSTIQGLEVDKQSLQQQIVQLEGALRESEKNANLLAKIDTSDPVMAKLQEEKEGGDAQVAFLNSVIVDMQRKNEEMKQRLIAMETGTVVNGADDNYEINDNLCKKPAPRLFCDICDVFDQHDTEDCPTQAMDEEDLTGTQHHGSRTEERPYCVICEVFGHSTDNCDDEQTF